MVVVTVEVVVGQDVVVDVVVVTFVVVVAHAPGPIARQLPSQPCRHCRR